MDKRIFLLINLLILASFVGFSYFLFVLRPVSGTDRFKNFQIQPGQGFQEIIAQLKAGNLIRSQKSAKIYALTFGLAHSLKPGKYVLNSRQSTPDILKILSEGPQPATIVIKEGMSLRDIEEVFSANKILSFERLASLNFNALKKDYEFLKTAKGLEGYLFPDTYKIFPESDPDTAARKLLDNFQRKAWPLIRECRVSSAKCHGLNSDEVLILASLIEKEVPNSEDRKIVAGILLKRLAIGMALQVDATLSYIKCGGSFFFCEKPAVERKDLVLASLYNTYRYPGLPPAAISNPGKDAIEAVLNAQIGPYLYYLSDPKTKKTIFSRTLEEHNENRAKYLGL